MLLCFDKISYICTKYSAYHLHFELFVTRNTDLMVVKTKT